MAAIQRMVIWSFHVDWCYNLLLQHCDTYLLLSTKWLESTNIQRPRKTITHNGFYVHSVIFYNHVMRQMTVGGDGGARKQITNIHTSQILELSQIGYYQGRTYSSVQGRALMNFNKQNFKFQISASKFQISKLISWSLYEISEREWPLEQV